MDEQQDTQPQTISWPASTETWGTRISELITVSEVCRHWKIARPYFYILIKKDKIPHVRIGQGAGTIRFRRDDLEKYLAERQIPRREEPAPQDRPAAEAAANDND